jgi:hypothetical protein
MVATLTEAYRKTFGWEPGDMADWQIAERLMDNFNVPLLGEGLAKQCIFRIVNHIHYPDRETTTRIVLRAEGFASELWDELPDEPHMAEIAHLENREYVENRRPRL